MEESTEKIINSTEIQDKEKEEDVAVIITGQDSTESTQTTTEALVIRVQSNENKTEVNLTEDDYKSENEMLAKYVVSLRTTFVADFGEDHYCSGAIITMKTILTAAHCLFIDRKNSFDQKYLRIVAGTPRRTQRTSSTQIKSVIEETPHYKYTYAIPVHNIAVLILNESLIHDGEAVERAQLPRETLQIGAECIAVGWNLLAEHGPSSVNIQHVKLTIMDEHFCSDNLPLPLTEGVFCAQNTKGTQCLASSGVPLFCNGVLTGIASVSKPCEQGGPYLFIDVYAYMDWIEQHKEDDVQAAYRSIAVLNGVNFSLIRFILLYYFVFYMFGLQL